MKTPENDKWIDELLADAFGQKESNADFGEWQKDHPEAVEILTKRARMGQHKAHRNPQKIRTIIMKSYITKLAAAAVIIMAVIFGITILEKSATPVYAIEQTIEALRQTRIVHMFCRDWQDNKVEIWLKLNPQSRLPDYTYLDYPIHDAQILSTPQISYQYLKSAGIFQISHIQLMNWDIKLESIIEDLATKIAGEKDLGGIQISRETDPNTGRDSLVILSESKENSIKVLIDPETKLPTSMHFIHTSNFGNFVKDFDEISFDEEPPAGLFDFVIPEGVTVINTEEMDKLKDDPNYGIACDNISKQETAELLAQKYWDAAIKNDFSALQKVYPVSNLEKAKEVLKRLYGSAPVELVEIGKLADQYGCGIGQVLPCTVRHQDGTTKQYKLIIKFRNINGQNSAIITGHYGMPQEIK